MGTSSSRATESHTVFLSYADEDSEIAEHLAAELERQNISTWYRSGQVRGLFAGMDRDLGINAALKEAEIVLLLISERYVDDVDALNGEVKHCTREYNALSSTQQFYMRRIPAAIDANMMSFAQWGSKIRNSLGDLVAQDCSALRRGRGAEGWQDTIDVLVDNIKRVRKGDLKHLLQEGTVIKALCTTGLRSAHDMANDKLDGFEPQRRDWVLTRVRKWYEQRPGQWSRAFVMLGDAGMGKSVLAAHLFKDGPHVLRDVSDMSAWGSAAAVAILVLLALCLTDDFRYTWTIIAVGFGMAIPYTRRRHTMVQTAFTVGAAHFFDYRDANTSDVRQVIYSIANQLCGAVPGLLDEVRKLDVDALAGIIDMALLFQRVVAKPCSAVAAPPAGRVVVIFDALDECEKTARAQVLGILQTDFLRDCPDWLGFLATSRKEDYIPLVLERFKPTLLDADEHNNVEDLHAYFNLKLHDAGLSGTELARATDVLAIRSEGVFLYARFADDALAQLANNVTLAAIEDETNFATGMSAVYAQYFGRFKREALGGSDALYEQVFGSLVVARGPLPMALLELGDLDVEDFAEAARNMLIVGDDGTLRFVHKSMADWISGGDKSNPRRDLVVKPAAGHKQLADLCFKQQSHPFALRHMLHHLCRAGRVPDAAGLLLDVSWLLTALQDDDVDPVDFVLDADPFLDKPGQPAGDVLRVLEKGANALRHDPREIASQLHGRLVNLHPALDSVDSSFTGRWLKPVKPSLEPAQSPLRKTLVGHWNSVESVAYCHELDMIVSGSLYKTVTLWKASTGQLLRSLEGHAREVDSVAVSAELDMIVSGSRDNTVKVWNASTGQLLRTLVAHSREVTSVAVSAELDMIVSGSWDETVKVWKASTGQLLRTLEGHSDWVTSVGVSAELDMIVSGSMDKTGKVWKASTGQPLHTLEGHSDWVRSVAVSAELDMIVSGSDDKTVKVWKASTGELLRRLDRHSHGVNTVAVSAELDMIVSGSADSTVKVWKASTGQLQSTLERHSGYVKSVAVSAELDMIVSGSADSTVKVWKASTGQLQSTHERHSGWVHGVAVSAELDMIVSGSMDSAVKVWKASTGQLLRTLEGHSASVNSVAVSADMITSRDGYGKTLFWNARTFEPIQPSESPESPQSDAVDAQGGFHVSLPGIDCVGFSTDAAVGGVVAREGDIVAVGDRSGMVHVLHVTSSG